MTTRLLCLCVLLVCAFSGLALPRLGGMQNVWEVGTPPVFVTENWADLSKWGNYGFGSPGITASGGYLTVTNNLTSGGSWFWYLNLIDQTNWWVHNENWEIRWMQKVVFTNASGGSPDTGVAIGLLNAYPPSAAADGMSYLLRLNCTNGQAVLTKLDGSTTSGNGLDMGWSSSNLTFSVFGDWVSCCFGRNQDLLYGSFSNVANGSFTALVTNIDLYGNNQSLIKTDPVISHLAIWPRGGQLIVSNFQYASTLKPPLAVVELGASRTYGQAAGEQRRRWITMVNTNLLTFKIRYQGNSWGRIEEWFAGLPELRALHPYEAILGEPDNALVEGDSEGTDEMNYTNYVAALRTNSVRRVRHITAFPRSDHDNTAIAAFVRSTYGTSTNYPADYVDAWLWTTNGGTAWLPLYNFDNVHPGFVGHAVIATNLLQSFFNTTPYPFTLPDPQCNIVVSNYSADWTFGNQFALNGYSYFAFPITLNAPANICGIDVRLLVGGTGSTFNAGIYTVSSGHPGVLLGSASGTFPATAVNPIVCPGSFNKVPFSSITGINSGTLSSGTYFVVIHSPASANYISVVGSGSGPACYGSLDGISWDFAGTVFDPYYIVRGK